MLYALWFFFFKQKTAYEMRISDWSSDVCSSVLPAGFYASPGSPMKTYNAKESEVDKKWVLIDADGLVLGRLASLIAMRLRGKHRAIFTMHDDTGDHAVVINAEKLRVTGRKADRKSIMSGNVVSESSNPGGRR